MGLFPAGIAVGVAVSFLFAAGQLAAVPRRALAVVLAGVVAVGGVLWLVLQAGVFDFSRISSTALLISGFGALLIMNAPLAIALGFPAMLYLLILGGPHLLMLPQRLIAGADNFVLLAIPLFILAGAFMETGGISRRLVDLAMALVGHLRGGLAHVTVVAEILFSGISGSTTADVAAMGALLIPSMEKAGYRKEEAICIVSAASAMGILVPPCLLMVILATLSDISVTALFLAGFLPAAVLAGSLMILIYIKARTQHWQVAARASFKNLGQAFVRAIVPLLLPVIIFGSIFTGAATVTESAVLAVVYALFVGVFFYRELPIRQTPQDDPGKHLAQRGEHVADRFRLGLYVALGAGPGAPDGLFDNPIRLRNPLVLPAGKRCPLYLLRRPSGGVPGGHHSRTDLLPHCHADGG